MRERERVSEGQEANIERAKKRERECNEKGTYNVMRKIRRG